MLRHFRLLALVALLLFAWAVAAAAAPFAYITNSGSSSVSVLDTATNTVTGTVPVDGIPGGVAMNVAGTRVYVVSSSPNAVSVIDTTTNTVLVKIPVAGFPTGVAVNPAGTRVYVTHFLSFGSTLSVIDAASNAVVATVAAGRFAAGVAVHPAGTRIYVAVRNGVAVVDAATNTVITTVPAGSRPFGLAVNPAGTRLYVANQGSGTVSVIETATDTVLGEVFVGQQPQGIGVSPDGTRVYVANNGSNSVSVINAVTNTLAGGDVPVGVSPYGIQVSPDGSRAYVANFSSHTVSVLDTSTNTVIGTVSVGSFPIAFGEFIRSQIVATTLTLSSVNPNSVLLSSSDPVTFTANLTRNDTGAGIAGAAVSFLVDAVTAGSATTGSGGSASFTYVPSALGPGVHQVKASFAGGTISGVTFKSSSSGTLTLQMTYRFIGFLPPLGEGWNNRTSGSTVPVKWRLTGANGTSITALNVVKGIQAGLISCGGGSPAGTFDVLGMGSLRYAPEDDQFIFLWRTPKSWTGQCYRFVLSLNDGTARMADFRFR